MCLWFKIVKDTHNPSFTDEKIREVRANQACSARDKGMFLVGYHPFSVSVRPRFAPAPPPARASPNKPSLPAPDKHARFRHGARIIHCKVAVKRFYRQCRTIPVGTEPLMPVLALVQSSVLKLGPCSSRSLEKALGVKPGSQSNSPRHPRMDQAQQHSVLSRGSRPLQKKNLPAQLDCRNQSNRQIQIRTKTNLGRQK